jgi:hypothetical protein
MNKEHFMVPITSSTYKMCSFILQYRQSSTFGKLVPSDIIDTLKSTFRCQIQTFICQLTNKHFKLSHSGAVYQPSQHFSIGMVSAKLPSLYVQQCFFVHLICIIYILSPNRQLWCWWVRVSFDLGYPGSLTWFWSERSQKHKNITKGASQTALLVSRKLSQNSLPD